MKATAYLIQEKCRTNDYSLVSPSDFQYTEAGTVDATTLVKSPEISLYCIDPVARQTIFVETTPEVDLSLSPFYYQGQYQHARRLFAVCYETFHELAIAAEKNIEKLAVIYSVGRCGSTLLSKTFAQIPGVLSLSEPDIFSQVATLRHPDRSNDAEILKLLSSCIRLLCKPSPQRNVSTYVLKLRSFGIELCDLMNLAFPQTKNIFLYRDLEAVVSSSIEVFDFMRNMLPTIKTQIDAYSRVMPLLKQYANYLDYADPYAIDLFVVAWLSVMDRYLQLRNTCIPFHTLRYEDLVTSPQQHVASLFNYCGFSDVDVAAACEVFARDAQAGTSLARQFVKQRSLSQKAVSLPEPTRIKERVNYLLAIHSEIQLKLQPLISEMKSSL